MFGFNLLLLFYCKLAKSEEKMLQTDLMFNKSVMEKVEFCQIKNDI